MLLARSHNLSLTHALVVQSHRKQLVTIQVFSRAVRGKNLGWVEVMTESLRPNISRTSIDRTNTLLQRLQNHLHVL